MPDDLERLRVRCACGWEAAGTRADVIAVTRDHGRRIHNMEASDEEIVAMATPIDTDDRPPG